MTDELLEKLAVLEDAKIISKYLGINCPKLKLNPNSTEGLTLENITHLGTKNGYNRRLLIHEFLHSKGFKHTYPSNFMSANVNDFGLVDFILKMCFNVNSKEFDRQYARKVLELIKK